MPGQIQTLRQFATGSFPAMLMAMAKDPAMIYWLDSQLNTRTRPQENFGREIMELFSLGVGNYTEQDVYAAARVFTGFNWQLVGDRASTATSFYTFLYRPNDHDPNAKEFTFPIYPDGGRIIPARAAAGGEQDALDLILALARHPATARRLATKLYKFFVNETSEPDQALISAMANAYLGNNYTIKPMLRTLFSSSQFRDPANFFQRYPWPVEFVVRAIKETGWTGFSVNTAMTPLTNMGQQLFEPPDVNGWELGPGLDLDLVDAGAHEFRLDARGQPAVQPRARCAAVPADAGTRARIHAGAFPDDGLHDRADHGDVGVPQVDGVDRHRRAAAATCSRPDAPDRRIRRISVQLEGAMNFSRRQFVKGGVTAFTFGFAAPQVLCDIAFAQGVPSRNLVVVYLSGGNDSLSTVIPYRDPFYASRRPTLAIPAGNVIADRHRLVERRARAASATDRVKVDLRRRPAGDRAANRLRQSEPIAFHRLRHLGHGEHVEHLGHRLARTLSRSADAADRSAGRVEHPARDAAAADGAPRSACPRSPAPRPTPSRARTPAPRPPTSGRRRRASPRTSPSIGRTWHLSTRRRRRRSGRSIASRRWRRIGRP